MLQFGICPLCQKDTSKAADTLNITRKTGLKMHLEVHGRENLRKLMEELKRLEEVGSLPEKLSERYRDLVCVDMLMEEIEKVFIHRKILVRVEAGAYGDVRRRILRVDPQSFFDKTEDFCFIVSTWITPEELSGIEGVVEAYACAQGAEVG